MPSARPVRADLFLFAVVTSHFSRLGEKIVPQHAVPWSVSVSCAQLFPCVLDRQQNFSARA
jgi:hypothetical protein